MAELQGQTVTKDVLISDQAADKMRGEIDSADLHRLKSVIDRIQSDPLSGSILVGTSQPDVVLRVAPAGDFRVVYRIDDETSTIQVLDIYNRREVRAG